MKKSRRMRANSPLFFMDNISSIQSKHLITFAELKNSVEHDRELTEIKRLVRDMIQIGLELEEAQAEDRVRIIIDPTKTLYKG